MLAVCLFVFAAGAYAGAGVIWWALLDNVPLGATYAALACSHIALAVAQIKR